MVRKAVLAVAILAVASVAMAQVALPYGHVMIKLNDYTSLYDANGRPLDPFAVPKHDETGIFYTQGSGSGQHPWVGTELRGILHCTSFGIETPAHGGTYTESWADGDAGIQITGGIQNFQVAAVRVTPDPDAPNKFDMRIYYTPVAPAPTDWDAPGALPGPTPTDELDREAGGRAYLKVSPYAVPSRFDSDPSGDGNGADEWGAPGSYDNDAQKRLNYPTVNVLDALGNDRVAAGFELLGMDGTAMPVGTLSGPDGVAGNADDIDYSMVAILHFEQYQVGPGAGLWGATGEVNLWFNSVRRDQPDEGLDSVALAHTMDTGGTVIPDYWGTGRDAWMLSNLQWGYAASGVPLTYDGWMFRSQDPFRFYNVPEPATCVLLAGGLLALVRRRKRS